MGKYIARSYTKYSVLHEHVARAEDALKRKLVWPEQVHHLNGNHLDNRNENLVVCPDMEYHRLLHIRLNAFNACGNWDYRACVICKEHDDAANMVMHTRKGNKSYIHVECRRQKDRAYYASKQS